VAMCLSFKQSRGESVHRDCLPPILLPPIRLPPILLPPILLPPILLPPILLPPVRSAKQLEVVYGKVIVAGPLNTRMFSIFGGGGLIHSKGARTSVVSLRRTSIIALIMWRRG
jgi:hypothetical protein